MILNQIKTKIVEAEKALNNRHLMTRKEVSFWNRVIKTNKEKLKFFNI